MSQYDIEGVPISVGRSSYKEEQQKGVSLNDYIEAIVAGAPKLTQDQIELLRRVFTQRRKPTDGPNL